MFRFSLVVFLFLFMNVGAEKVWNFEMDRVAYYHSHSATWEELEKAAAIDAIFEIDLCFAHSSFHPNVTEGMPYIGHPEEFYTILKKKFPADNVSLDVFQDFLREHPSMKVLIDIKDVTVFPYLEKFVNEIGAKRCLAHAFIKNWTIVPEGTLPGPHWYREDIDLDSVDAFLRKLGVPLIANCRGFSNQHMEEQGVISQIIRDCERCESIIALGIYYPEVSLPKMELLKSFNQAGYYAWVNGNLEGIDESLEQIRHIAMSDEIGNCTQF